MADTPAPTLQQLHARENWLRSELHWLRCQESSLVQHLVSVSFRKYELELLLLRLSDQA